MYHFQSPQKRLQLGPCPYPPIDCRVLIPPFKCMKHYLTVVSDRQSVIINCALLPKSASVKSGFWGCGLFRISLLGPWGCDTCLGIAHHLGTSHLNGGGSPMPIDIGKAGRLVQPAPKTKMISVQYMLPENASRLGSGPAGSPFPRPAPAPATFQLITHHSFTPGARLPCSVQQSVCGRAGVVADGDHRVVHRRRCRGVCDNAAGRRVWHTVHHEGPAADHPLRGRHTKIVIAGLRCVVFFMIYFHSMGSLLFLLTEDHLGSLMHFAQ